jgi:hypothetical protein
VLERTHYCFGIGFAESHFTCLCSARLLVSPQLFFFLPAIFEEIFEFFAFVLNGPSRLILGDFDASIGWPDISVCYLKCCEVVEG